MGSLKTTSSLEEESSLIKEGITKDDVCFDPCCGSGTFLLAFMKKQRTIPDVNIEEVKQNLIGIEYDPDIFLLSVASMLIRGDGKANLQNEEFFR